MDETTYLKLKILTLEAYNVQLKAEQAVRASLDRYRQGLVDAGLDPSVVYTFDDAAHNLVAPQKDS